MQKEQFIRITEYGTKFYFSDREMTKLHREDGPAIEWSSGRQEWYINNKRHREDGPAIEYPDGHKGWYLNGERHREDGPAIEYADGSKSWFINGKRHREDGPAVVWADGYKEWYINGEQLTEAEFNARINPIELTLDEIASKFGVSVNSLKIKK
jgi:hypothetical protein